jgi:L-aspartate oxidase
MKTQPELIVAGSGVAGLSAALAAARDGARVTLVTADIPASGSSWWAQGGIAAAVGPGDLPRYHAADTLAVGARLNDEHAVDVLVEDGRRAALGLIESGMAFEGDGYGPDLGLEAGHGHRRILHAGGGATGAMVSAALLADVMRHPLIEMLSDTPVDALVVEGGCVVGVQSGENTLRARGVVLATGGYAGLWARSTNPPGNRGSGLWLAWRAGATLADLELVQFHPTALDLPGAPAFLLSEALRGEGALLVDAHGREVVDPLLARDVVARAIARHRREHGPVYLSLRHLDPGFVWEHFASIATQLRRYGLDLARDAIPVAPAAHYCMGGVRTDTDGRTDVPGLYVAGEAACTGAQGANRLASNSLLECLVFGGRAARAVLRDESAANVSWPFSHLPNNGVRFERGNTEICPDNVLGQSLDRDMGVQRDGESLARLCTWLPDPNMDGTPAGHTIAALAARAALLRRESRGAHYRTDAPTTDPAWQGRILWKRDCPPRFEKVTFEGRQTPATIEFSAIPTQPEAHLAQR